jgi:hypothetical protein
MLPSFQGSNFNLYYNFAPRFAYILYMLKCDVHHLMNSFYYCVNMKYVINCMFCNAMYVHRYHKIGWLVVCRYQCQYGLNDLTSVVKDIT